MIPLLNYSRIILAVAFAITLLRTTAPARAIEHEKPHGEPYQLLGKRLVFTTWYFVRPGQLEWQNDQGQSAGSDVKFGPFDAHFKSVDAPSGIEWVAEQPQRVGPIISRDRPWEKMGLSITTILRESDTFRMWGSCQGTDGKRYACYFESKDGRSWERPNLGLVEFEGSRENNLLPYPVQSVFIDPTAAPEARYKTVREGDEPDFATYKQKRPFSVMATETDPGRAHAIRAAVSPDGLNWTELAQSISVEPSDTLIVATYDPRLKRYVMFTRSYMVGPRAEATTMPIERRHRFVQRRAIGRSESETFEAFPLSEVIIESGNDMPPTDTYYTNCYTTLPGAPDHHVMFPAIYHQNNDTMSIELFTSYDGKMWHRAPGSPLMGNTNFGQWDGGSVFTQPNLLELPDGSWALPYTGYVYPHKYPRAAWAYDPGLMIWPKGRLMALRAKDRGEFTTVAILAPGSKLRINALTERAGSILVEAADLGGKPIAGRTFDDAIPIVGDQHQTLVKWKAAGDLGIEVNQPLVLRFRMDQAKIYALDFE
ncbi:MAG: hypothetical protein ABIP55_12930 [Tepidisphaeraceae bacterium]